MSIQIISLYLALKGGRTTEDDEREGEKERERGEEGRGGGRVREERREREEGRERGREISLKANDVNDKV